MSRYIDRDAVRRAIQEYCFSPKEITPVGIAKVVMSVPTVDVVEVVRCKDCKWYSVAKWDDEVLHGCHCSSGMVDIEADGYCSYGERLYQLELSYLTLETENAKLTERNEQLRGVKEEYETFIGGLKPKIDETTRKASRLLTSSSRNEKV